MPRSKQVENKIQKNKPKDKDVPKKGKSAFFFFVDAKREDAKKRNPDLQHKEIISELSKEWKKLSENDKLPYINLANKESERFRKEKEAYQAKIKSEEDDYLKKEKGTKRKAETKPAEEPKLFKISKTNDGEIKKGFKEKEG